MHTDVGVVIFFVVLGLVVVTILVGVVILAARGRRGAGRCPGCGASLVPGRNQCPFCGTPYARTPTPPGLPAGQVPQLVGLEGPYQGQAIPLAASELTIGRSEDNAVRVEGMLVSRHHARIVRQGNDYVLYDLESMNGTYVNGRRIAHHVLQPGDQILIGPAVLAFQVPGVVVSTQAPSPPARTPSVAYAPGGTLKDYQLGERLGVGGMAEVFRATHRRDNTTVAIKILTQTDPYLVDKFAQEGKIGQTLQHLHIARIYVCGRSNGSFYIVMEYIDSGTLRQRLVPGHPLPLDTVIGIVGQTCEALEYAHQMNVIHRDIKPENIMFSAQEGVKIVDFGIAKMTQAVTRTSDGMIVGTPYYMSYEQARGGKVFPASDVYSLGVVMYEMLTGRVPFDGQPLTVVHKHLTEQPTPPRAINPDIPREVETVVLRALTKDRNQRFRTAGELAAALGYTYAAPAPPPDVHFQAPVGPRPARLAFVGGPAKGRAVQLPEGYYPLNRRDIDPSDMLMSREHAQVVWDGSRYWLEDLGSRNGTFVNGRRLAVRGRHALQPGDIINLGNSMVRFEQ